MNKTIKFETDILMYKYIMDKVDNGYLISKGFKNNIIISKGNDNLLLTCQDVNLTDDYNKNIDILNKNFSNVELRYPNFNNSMLNIISGIRNNYGYESKYQNPKYLFDKKYKHCIILLLDGLGVNVLENNLDSTSFLRRHFVHTNQAIYPSTTAASTTTTICGKEPIESGWLGWENYIKEFNKDVILFTGQDYFTGELTKINMYEVLPYTPFYSDMNVKGMIIQPDFKNHFHDISEVLDKSLETINNTDIQYVYYTNPDSIMHITGSYSNETKEALKEIDKKVEEYANSLPEDTILIISADHGHTNVEAINIYANKLLMNLLERRPANESRCLAFKVKEGCKDKFKELFELFYKDCYILLDSKEAIDKGYFGTSKDINPRSYEFLADFVAIATNKYYFKYNNDSVLFKSHHAGITKDEMDVPVIVYKK